MLGPGILLTLWALQALACTGLATDLAGLDEISPREIEPGEELTLSGSGFVVGPATLLLEGTLSAPGQRSRRQEVRLELPALATSATGASARLARRHFERLGPQHSTFSGRATLVFESRAGPDAPPVTASLGGVRLELFPCPTSGGVATREASREGRALLHGLGVATEVLPGGRGLLVESVTGGSPADRAGIRPSDVVVTAGAVTVASVADLTPPTRTRRLVLGLRDAAGGLRHVGLSLVPAGAAPDGDRIAALAIGGSALLLVLLIAGPLRGPLRLLHRGLLAGALGPGSLLRDVVGPGATSASASLAALLAFAAAPFVVMALAWTSVVVVVGIAWLVSAVAAATATTGLRRVPAALHGLVRGLPLALAAAVGATGGASVDVRQIVAAQGALPWQWEAVSGPGSLLLLVVAIATTTSGETRRPGPAGAALRGLGGAVLAAMLLGGWAAPAGHDIAGQLLFAAKAWTLGLCFPYAARSRVLVAVPIATALAAVATAPRILALPEWATVASPWLAGALAVLVVLPLSVRALLARRGDEAARGSAPPPMPDRVGPSSATTMSATSLSRAESG